MIKKQKHLGEISNVFLFAKTKAKNIKNSRVLGANCLLFLTQFCYNKTVTKGDVNL